MFGKSILTIATATILVSAIACGVSAANAGTRTSITGTSSFSIQKYFKLRSGKLNYTTRGMRCCRPGEVVACDGTITCKPAVMHFNKFRK